MLQLHWLDKGNLVKSNARFVLRRYENVTVSGAPQGHCNTHVTALITSVSSRDPSFFTIFFIPPVITSE